MWTQEDKDGLANGIGQQIGHTRHTNILLREVSIRLNVVIILLGLILWRIW